MLQLKAEPDADELWSEVATADPGAVAELYDRHGSEAYALAVRLVGPASAEDVVHDSFLALIKNPAAYDRQRGAFRSWLLRVVHNRCVNLLRSRRSAPEDELQFLPDPADQPPEQVLSSLAASEVQSALRGLQQDQREALVLTYYGGLSHSELAVKLEIPLGTAKSRVRRGLFALRDMLSSPGLEARP
ncbi:MAG TPA: sigma-70 family RNA polymerase sigma factor [Chloroflexota bacterium]|nr:sigma-70 family RNA polymerase sigma factor [Chloroflexota bacterium]